jgi:hypothetical protein
VSAQRSKGHQPAAQDGPVKEDETKAPEFQRVLRNMLSTPPKKQSELKGSGAEKRKRGRPAKDR